MLRISKTISFRELKRELLAPVEEVYQLLAETLAPLRGQGIWECFREAEEKIRLGGAVTAEQALRDD